MKVGIIFIGTNKYRRFFEGYYEGITKNFLRDHEKSFFVITDDENDSTFDKPRVFKSKIEHRGWPYITLHRFKFIKAIETKLQSMDYIFFIDADLWCVSEVKADEVPLSSPLVGVQHPGFVGKIGTFETDTTSNASIFDGYYDLTTYRQGCLWGGKTSDFLKMVEELDRRVDDDMSRQKVAVWHDESHMNKYFLQNPSLVETLHPGFAQPQNGYESIRESFPTKFVHLHKDDNDYPRFAGVK